MKIIMQFKVNLQMLPLDYRRLFVSFIKASLCKTNPKLFEELYGIGKTVQKPYAFSIKIRNPIFEENRVLITENTFQAMIITNDSMIGVDLYKGFQNMLNREYPMANDNSMRLIGVRIQNHHSIKSDEVVIQMHSPLVVRSHERGKKDYYYQYDEDGFNDALKICVRMQLTNSNNDMNDDFSLTPLKAKKIVIKTFGISVPGSLGVYKFTGNSKLISYLYQTGIGSRRSQGFGVFEVMAKN